MVMYMAKTRVYKIAKELGLDSKEVIRIALACGIEKKVSISSSLDDTEKTKIVSFLQKENNGKVLSKKFTVVIRKAKKVEIEDEEPTKEPVDIKGPLAKKEARPASGEQLESYLGKKEVHDKPFETTTEPLTKPFQKAQYAEDDEQRKEIKRSREHGGAYEEKDLPEAKKETGAYDVQVPKKEQYKEVKEKREEVNKQLFR